jgi:hypothetical protein
MNEISKYIFSYFGGIVFIIIGFLIIRYMYKQPVEIDDSPLQGYISGWIGAIGTILFGILIIIGKLQGKL